MKRRGFDKMAVWAITPNGVSLAKRIRGTQAGACVYAPAALAERSGDVILFDRLADTLKDAFRSHDAHVFVMSTGIVVRLIAPYLQHKTIDPAVIVVDEKGNHAISLLSGHLGGANDLAHTIAEKIGAEPVITTATDVSGLPAIDVLAAEKGLLIENPGTIKHVGMALLKGDAIDFHDPYGFMIDMFPKQYIGRQAADVPGADGSHATITFGKGPGVFIDDRVMPLPERVLILRPASLTAGIGCNRNTPKEEIRSLLMKVIEENRLSDLSLARIGTIDLKSDEEGLLALSKELDIPISFYGREELRSIDAIETPSAMVEKHIGVKSVCEAAAILTAGMGKLIVPKQTTRNVTVAIARTLFS